jgi:hypothetical protein
MLLNRGKRTETPSFSTGFEYVPASARPRPASALPVIPDSALSFVSLLRAAPCLSRVLTRGLITVPKYGGCAGSAME